MKIFCVLIALTLFNVSSSARADGLTVTSVSAIPEVVLQALLDLCRPCSFADFDAQWNPTDVIINELPRRRLVKVTHTDTEWSIQYEHGGRGRHFHNVTFALQPIVHYVRGSSCAPTEGCHEW